MKLYTLALVPLLVLATALSGMKKDSGKIKTGMYGTLELKKQSRGKWEYGPGMYFTITPRHNVDLHRNRTMIQQVSKHKGIPLRQYLVTYKNSVRQVSYEHKYYKLQKIRDQKIAELQQNKGVDTTRLRQELRIIEAELRNPTGRFLADLVEKPPVEAMRAWANLQALHSAGKLGVNTWGRAQSAFKNRQSLQLLAQELHERMAAVKAEQEKIVLPIEDHKTGKGALSKHTDLVLTTPTRITNISPDVDAKVTHELLQQITVNPVIDFDMYVKQVGDVLEEMKQKELYTDAVTALLFIKEFAEGTAEYLVHVAQHPVEYVQKFVEANIELTKELGALFVEAACAPDERFGSAEQMMEYAKTAPQTEKIIKLLDHIYETVPQMNRKDWAKLSSRLFADSLILRGVGKSWGAVKNARIPAVIKENPLFSDIHKSLEEAFAKHPELVTLEGVTFKTTQAMEDANAVKNAEQTVERVAKKTVKNAACVEKVVGSARITTKQAMELAENLGFRKTNFRSNGQLVFQKGKKFITIDVDSHCGGMWKMADSVKNLARKETRMGTYDQFLNRIGD